MTFTDSVKSKKTAQLIFGLVVLMILLSSCVTVRDRTAYVLKCQDAEKAISKAEKEFNEAAQELVQGNKDEKMLSSISKKMQTLAEAQESAFQFCNRDYSNQEE